MRFIGHRNGGAPEQERPDLPIYSAADSQQKQKRGGGGDDDGAEAGDGPQKLAKKGDELKEEMDALMDEIDEVLEENAEEFVKNYVQRGGE
jgi:prokaryotic ubiquitin-like protein Pup